MGQTYHTVMITAVSHHASAMTAGAKDANALTVAAPVNSIPVFRVDPGNSSTFVGLSFAKDGMIADGSPIYTRSPATLTKHTPPVVARAVYTASFRFAYTVNPVATFLVDTKNSRRRLSYSDHAGATSFAGTMHGIAFFAHSQHAVSLPLTSPINTVAVFLIDTRDAGVVVRFGFT
jgi:hypothetical protein